MKAIQTKILNNLKKLTAFLEKRWRLIKAEEEKATVIHSLAPKTLTDEKEIAAIRPYVNNLKQAIDTKGINNIAITGSYGSGKSTILNTFRYLYPRPRYEYLNISLASFKDNKQDSDDLEFERRLEISILQQMFYHVKPSKIPDSRFKRIINVGSGTMLLYSLCAVAWIYSAVLLFYFGNLNNLNPSTWKFGLSPHWTTVFSSVAFFAGLGFLSKSIYRLLKNSKINKINIKGEFELGASTSDKSIFNQHLEEILYFFERTRFNVVVIEDIDRFNSTDIFTKLRELNILVNNSTSIGRVVKFVYAVRDDMFKDKSERVKFFEFIIPVIPFINPSNAGDQLSKLISEAELEGVLSPEFTSDVVTFIDDIDMRLLINVFQEFQLYQQMINVITPDKLFAIIVYKNLYPDDFGELQKNNGKLHGFFANKHIHTKAIVDQLRQKNKEIDKEIESLQNEVDRPIKELRAVYINQLVSMLEKFQAFSINEQKVSATEVLDDNHFNIVASAPKVNYFSYKARKIPGTYPEQFEVIPSPTTITSEVSFSEIEKIISDKLTYQQREKALRDKANGKIDKLKSQQEKLKSNIVETENMSVHELFEIPDIKKDLGEFENNNLMRNLLLNGYIDEHYEDYISLFHEVNLTRQDYEFEKKIKSGIDLPFDYPLEKFESLLKNIPDKYFKKQQILNISLLTYLLSNPERNTIKLNYFYDGLSFDGEHQFQFTQAYIKSEPAKAKEFIKRLCGAKTSLWKYINEKANLPEGEKQGLLRLIFEHAELDAILKFDNVQSLDEYLSGLPDFFAFASLLTQTETIQKFITERDLIIQNLGTRLEAQKNLFEQLYTGNYYELNADNVSTVLKAKNKLQGPDFNSSYYTSVIETSLPELLSYIDDNLEDFVRDVLLRIDGNTDEEADVILRILNRKDVSLNLKEQLLRGQNANILWLELAGLLEVKQMILRNNKMVVNWTNVLDYYDSTEGDEFDEVLAEYLNQDENFSFLSKEELNDSLRSQEYLERFEDKVIYSKTLTDEAYRNLVESMPYTNDNLDFSKLNSNRIRHLISAGIIALTVENVSGIIAKDKTLITPLVEMNQDDFPERIAEFELESVDLVRVLNSTAITDANKFRIIEKIGPDKIISSRDLGTLVVKLLPVDRQVPLSYEVLKELLRYNPPIEKMISVIHLNSPALDNTKFQSLIEGFGGEYVKIFRKQHKPKFDDTPSHLALFDNLKNRRLILKYQRDEKKDQIKVFAKYQ